MDISKIEDMFSKISEIVSLDNIGYHRIVDGRLIPVHKTSMGLDIEKWKQLHKEKPAYVTDSCILLEMVDNKKVIVIEDVQSHEGCTDQLVELGIKSLIIIPIIEDYGVYGFIEGVSMDKKCTFTKEQIEKSIDIVKLYEKHLK